MPMHLHVEVTIAASPADIAAVLFDPSREPEWASAVESVEILDNALRPGARVLRQLRVAGVDATVTTEVESVHFPHVLAMRIVDGPVTGSIRYDVLRTAEGSLVRLRGMAEPGGVVLSAQAAMLEGPAQTLLRQDLERLKQIVEG